MSSVRDNETFLTFSELQQLGVDEIAMCIDKFEALSVCERSTVDSAEIFNMWVHKLFKAYDLETFTKGDWLQIFEFLEKILSKFILDLTNQKEDKLLTQLTLWWTDTLELLKWLESILNRIEVYVLAIILHFILEIIIKTCTIADKSIIKPVVTIHQKLLQFLSTHLLMCDIQNMEVFMAYNRVLLLLCDAAAVISIADVKISIETWRSTVKFTNKCNQYCREMKGCNNSKENNNSLIKDCTEKPLLGILNELKKLFQHLLDDATALNNANFLKVAQFYLKLLKIILQNCDATSFPVPEFMELYSLCMHQLRKKNERQILDYLQNDLCGILHILYQQTNMEQHLCDHLLHDTKSGESCDLILNFMEFHSAHFENSICSLETATRIFDILFDGHLIVADDDKYCKIVSCYVAITAQDATGQMHMKWCNNVLECCWIKTYVSFEILVIFYSTFLKEADDRVLAGLEFWIQCWHKLNMISSTLPALGPQKILIEIILKSLVPMQLPYNTVEKIFNKFPYPEILLLKCGHNNLKLHIYLQNNLTKYLCQVNDMNMKRKDFNKLNNLLDIWCRYPHFVKNSMVKQDLVKAFLKIYSMPLSEMHKFQTFFNRTFFIFQKINSDETHHTILKCLQDNSDKTKAIASVFMLDYLMKSHETSKIKSLIPHEFQDLQKFLHDIENKENDFNSLYDLYGKQLKANENLTLNRSKRPRLAQDLNSSSYKIILNQMLDYSKQLSNSKEKFDSNEIYILNSIKDNIQKCLLK